MRPSCDTKSSTIDDRYTKKRAKCVLFDAAHTICARLSYVTYVCVYVHHLVAAVCAASSTPIAQRDSTLHELVALHYYHDSTVTRSITGTSGALYSIKMNSLMEASLYHIIPTAANAQDFSIRGG